MINWPVLRFSRIDRTDSRQEGRIIDKEEKLSGGSWRNRNSLSPFSPPRGSRGKRDAVTWRWISFSPRPISTDFHNGSTYECTHLSPTLPFPLPSQLFSLALPRIPLAQSLSLQPSVCPFFHSLIETLVPSVVDVLPRNGAQLLPDTIIATGRD